MILRAHTPCLITPTRGSDVYGAELLGTPISALCGVVKIQGRTDKTSVRADSSATRGYAEEVTVAARLLFAPGVQISKGDKVDVLGMSIRVIEVMPRINLYGRLDHNQVDGVMWA